MFSSCRLLMWFISVSRFLYYKLDRWFSSSNSFTINSQFGALYSLLFGICQGSVLNTVL